MLFKKATLDKIARGEVRLAFRRWKRPTVREGGTLKTAIGVLAIDAVDRVLDIAESEVEAAGATSLEELKGGLDREGDLYRVSFHLAGPDPRIALRQSTQDISATLKALAKLDRRGAWTLDYLRLIQKEPGERASILARSVGLETPKFKSRIRLLKDLGLTESLSVGYRLSQRGIAILNEISG